MSNEKALRAKEAQYNEFYTQYEDIQYEVNAYIDYNPDVFRDKVILLSKEANTKMNDVEKKVAQSAASFLGRQMEI